MKKLTRIKQIKGVRSLYGAFLYITLVPLIIYGLVITAYSSYNLTGNVKTKVESSLKNVDVCVAAAYDSMYEGDYNVVIYDDAIEAYKGMNLISDNHTLLDRIKSESGAEISLFFYDTRVLTTITDSEGKRYVGTGAAPAIVTEVMATRKGCFFDNVEINGVDYYAYYEPVFNADGSMVLGMVGAAEPASDVTRMAWVSILKNLIITLLALVVTSYFIMHFTSGIIDVIKKIMRFTGAIAGGDLSKDLDPTVINRQDELGEMGRLTMKLRGSLRKLIERDALTGIYNRRYGRNKLQELKDNGEKYCVSIGDIDFFKKFNDTFGHECGDEVLKEVARVLRETMQKYGGYAIRWGGEEFLLIYSNKELDAANTIAEEVLNRIRENKVEYEGIEHAVTMSFGVTNSLKTQSIDEDVNAADALLYEAKESGRNRVVCRVTNAAAEE